jgi:hypothetical protein
MDLFSFLHTQVGEQWISADLEEQAAVLLPALLYPFVSYGETPAVTGWSDAALIGGVSSSYRSTSY